MELTVSPSRNIRHFEQVTQLRNILTTKPAIYATTSAVYKVKFHAPADS